jgi:hypothetical protein
MQRTNRDWRTLVYCWAITSVVILFSGCQSKPDPANKNSQAGDSSADESQKLTTVDPGDPDSAVAYYGETLTELGLNSKNLSAEELVKSMDLSQILVHLGYPDLTPKYVENAPSAELMTRFSGDILSSAFFAPKITDVSVTPINPGWRKLVRFKAKGDALKKGISAGFLLFNKFQGAKESDYDKDPFGPKSNESLNTQLILVKTVGATLRYPIYFLVFGPRSELITFLTATFDARAPDIVAENKYYVPNACADCHGGLKGEDILTPDYEKLKLNYLDTDHWFDRLEDDFAFLKEHTCGGKSRPCAVLYDGRDDESEFERAFKVLIELNREIKVQNEKVKPPPPESFQWRAVTKWLDLHETDSRHKDVFARALPPFGGGEPWKADNETDKELLPLLNRYCFRCHSSLRFSIFDRPAVVRKKKDILQNMTRILTDHKKMPQDRNLDCSDETLAHKERILDLVRSLPGATPSPSPTPSPTCPAPTPKP